VLLAPEHDSSLAASDSAGQKTASGNFLRFPHSRAGKNRLQTTDSRRVAGQAPTKTASGRLDASIYDPQVEFLEIGVNVNGVQAWKVYGPDLNGVYGGMQGTGGFEATIMDGTGAATGVLNDFWGNVVATVSNSTVTWSPTHVAGYGPLPDSAATPLTDATQLAQATVWRGHRIDPTGFYYLGARYYEPTSGRFLSCDPLSFTAGSDLYSFCNGDCVNYFDPDGRVEWGLLGKSIVGVLANSVVAVVGAAGAETGVGAVAAVYGAYGVGTNLGNIGNALFNQSAGPTGPAQTVTSVLLPNSQVAQQAAQVADLAVPLVTGNIAGDLDAAQTSQALGWWLGNGSTTIPAALITNAAFGSLLTDTGFTGYDVYDQIMSELGPNTPLQFGPDTPIQKSSPCQF
jgi:RHS repeat-associated protein